MISIQTHAPLALSPLIKSFWRLQVSERLGQPYVEDILPDGHPEIILHANTSPVRRKSGSKTWQADPAAYFTGQYTKSYTQALRPGTVLYGVRFHPHTQALFYNLPDLSTDTLLPLADIDSTDTLASCVHEDAGKTFSRLEKMFTKKAARVKNKTDAFQYVDAAIRNIMMHNGNVKIQQLEKITGVSSRHLEKSFQKFVGLRPKQFCNVIRYSHFISFREKNPHMTLTTCALETGFYDQSQLIHLSQPLSGQSPKAYFNTPNHINTFFLKP
ncbi:helix-turn-helix domain-containing protein [Chryseolinea lacunae]|uniref:AraC family transcriptional regulator n=1 Tax=Chryseolinea lacunae TaxID=2801331 RepID=A0ABS1KTB1_9BACT|nr:helix-turn-helix domain-containing protein [Chryseolinea lacunae]MBL0742696.1 AraC family transcriptional regulator [Chryseolinea lacunae]